VTLADCLTTSSTVDDGLALYDRRRRRTTQRLAAMSTRISRLAQTRRFLPVRDTVIRLALAFGPPS
jgi:hypothetical protein